MKVRAFFSAVQVPAASPPYDNITLKIYYPAAPTGSEMENMTGVIPADQGRAPFPIVIFMPGINVEPQAYHWLAQKLVAQGLVIVTYLWVAEEMPGFISVTPGVDIEAIRPGRYGHANPTCPALKPILDHLADINQPSSGSRLAGLLELETVILGGHSAGGTMALQNVHPDWFPQVKAAFTYGAHTMTSTMLGYPAGAILPVHGQRPILLLGGERDGVIEASVIRYGLKDGSATLALEKTFSEALAGGRGDQFLVILAGANHFTAVYPLDETTGRPFLDHPAVENEMEIREMIGALIDTFIQGVVRQNPDAKQQFLAHISADRPLITLSQTK